MDTTTLVIHDVSQLSDEIASLYNNETLSDVALVVDNFEIPAHKIILAARSAYFRALFFGEMKEKKEDRIHLKRFDCEIPIEAFKILLKYAYSGKMEINAEPLDLVIDILSIADKYAFTKVTTKISEFLKDLINIDNCCEIFTAASVYNFSKLKDAALEFIDTNALECTKTEGFVKLPYKALIEIISRNSLNADEVDIFNATVIWVDHNSVENATLPTIFENIRLSLIDPKILLRSIRSSGYFSSDDILEAINEQLNHSDRIIRRDRIPKENVATIENGAKVIEGDSHPQGMDASKILFNGEINPNEDVNHLIGEGSIIIQLKRIYMLNSIGFLLWNGDDRCYSYSIELSTNNKTYTKLGEYSNRKGWQLVHFTAQPIQYIRFVGTYNSKRDCFCLIHLECPAQQRSMNAVDEQKRQTQFKDDSNKNALQDDRKDSWEKVDYK